MDTGKDPSSKLTQLTEEELHHAAGGTDSAQMCEFRCAYCQASVFGVYKPMFVCECGHKDWVLVSQNL